MRDVNQNKEQGILVNNLVRQGNILAVEYLKTLYQKSGHSASVSDMPMITWTCLPLL